MTLRGHVTNLLMHLLVDWFTIETNPSKSSSAVCVTDAEWGSDILVLCADCECVLGACPFSMPLKVLCGVRGGRVFID